jgi:3-dehydroquinate dehydratase-1
MCGSTFFSSRQGVWLFCVPLVAQDSDQLKIQAEIARDLKPDLIEWRADFSKDLTPAGLIDAAKLLRNVVGDVPVIYTLRIKAEGGAQEMGQAAREESIEAVTASGLVDLVDFELCNGPEFCQPIIKVARKHGVRVILSYHDFKTTPPNEVLLATIGAMGREGADVAKIAVMPQQPGDVLRLLQVTLEARRTFPNMPLVTMSMGALGSISRVAGFLYGSDMAFAVGKEASAPGQIPIADARIMTELLVRYGA